MHHNLFEDILKIAVLVAIFYTAILPSIIKEIVRIINYRKEHSPLKTIGVALFSWRLMLTVLDILILGCVVEEAIFSPPPPFSSPTAAEIERDIANQSANK